MQFLGNGISFTRAMRSTLGQAVFFEHFTPADINTMATYMHAYRANKGITIFSEGEPNSHLCVLAEGLVGVYRKEELGNHQRIKTIQPGEIFGKTSLVDDHPYSVSLIAEATCTLLLMSHENFRRCVDRNPALGARILQQIARRLSLRLRQAHEHPAGSRE